VGEDEIKKNWPGIIDVIGDWSKELKASMILKR
jgi:hypothetical protein